MTSVAGVWIAHSAHVLLEAAIMCIFLGIIVGIPIGIVLVKHERPYHR